MAATQGQDLAYVQPVYASSPTAPTLQPPSKPVPLLGSALIIKDPLNLDSAAPLPLHLQPIHLPLHPLALPLRLLNLGLQPPDLALDEIQPSLDRQYGLGALLLEQDGADELVDLGGGGGEEGKFVLDGSVLLLLGLKALAGGDGGLEV